MVSTPATATTSKQSASDNIRKQWTTNRHIQKDKKSVVSKLSSTGKSIKTICSQLTHQQQENKKLVNLTEKLREDSKNGSESHQLQMIKRNH
jgi:peptidoglycan hydrolase CwlO-like protein